jgi:hypothetical protein
MDLLTSTKAGESAKDFLPSAASLIKDVCLDFYMECSCKEYLSSIDYSSISDLADKYFSRGNLTSLFSFSESLRLTIYFTFFYLEEFLVGVLIIDSLFGFSCVNSTSWI